MKKKQTSKRYLFLKTVLAFFAISGILLCAFSSSISQKIKNWLSYSHLIGQEMLVIQNGDLLLLKFGLIRAHYSVRPLSPSLEGVARFPEWSPDGEWVAFDYNERFAQWDEDERSIYIVKADGSKLQRIGSGVSPQWDPSGQVIYFTDGTDTETIKAIDLDTGMISDVLHSRDCGTGGVIGNYRVSKTHQRALLQIYDWTYEWNAETESCSPFLSAWDAVASIHGDVAMGRYRSGYNAFQEAPLVTELASGSHAYLVEGGSPSWSPDGRYFVYDSPHDANLWSWSLYVYDTETGHVYDLGMNFSHPSWRP